MLRLSQYTYYSDPHRTQNQNSHVSVTPVINKHAFIFTWWGCTTYGVAHISPQSNQQHTVHNFLATMRGLIAWPIVYYLSITTSQLSYAHAMLTTLLTCGVSKVLPHPYLLTTVVNNTVLTLVTAVVMICDIY